MKLTPEEKELIRQTETMLDVVLNQVESARRFKMGDYLIAFHARGYYNTGSSQRAPVTNSYGVPKKFQVIAVDRHGVPYIKELNKNGNPVGAIISLMSRDGRHDPRNPRFFENYEFEVDPDYTDSIILDDSGFDATSLHKDKSALFKTITDHNKKIKVKVREVADVVSYMGSLKVGDIVWRSHKTSFTVTKISSVPKTPGGKTITDIAFIDAIDNKGKNITLSVNSLRHTAIYSDRPRTYKELKDNP
jgi:hypothetical protein